MRNFTIAFLLALLVFPSWVLGEEPDFRLEYLIDLPAPAEIIPTDAEWRDADPPRSLSNHHSWWRLQLVASPPDEPLILQFREAFDARLTLFLPPDYQPQVIEGLVQGPPQLGSLHRLSIALPDQAAEAPVYLRIDAARSQPIGLSIRALATWHQDDLVQVRFTSAITAGSIVLALACALYAWALRRRAFLLLAVWVLAGAFYFQVFSGEVVAWWPWTTDGSGLMRLNSVVMNIGIVAGYMAMYRFLDIQRHFNAFARFYRVLLWLAAAMVLFNVIAGGSWLATQSINLVLLMLAISTIVAALRLTTHPGSQAWFFLLGWGAPTAAGIARAWYFMTYQGTPVWLEYLHPISHLSGALVLVLATARAARYAEREMRDAQSRASTDPLTGLPNRATLDARLKVLVRNAEDIGRPLTVLFLDIDHFKHINDRHGHAVGDACLKHLARILNRHVRLNDLVARYGGEEFVLVLESDLDSAARLAEDLRKAVAEQSRTIEGVEIGMTISIGLAEHAPGEPVDRLLERSDLALYQAKHAGRNRVVVADREIQSRGATT